MIGKHRAQNKDLQTVKNESLISILRADPTRSLGEMARFYNLPGTQAGCLTDSKSPGVQAIMEKMTSALPLVLSGVDLINGIRKPWGQPLE